MGRKDDRAAWEAVIDKRNVSGQSDLSAATTAPPHDRAVLRGGDVGGPATLPVRNGGVAQLAEQRIVDSSVASSNLVAPAKPSKYFARRVYHDFMWFASEAECRRYTYLRNLERSRAIVNLVVHPTFPLHSQGGEYIGRYTADFAYSMRRRTDDAASAWVQIVEDVKSPRTAEHPAYRKNCRMVKAQYHIDVETVMA